MAADTLWLHQENMGTDIMTVCFQNKEEIDLRGLLTFGVSVKGKDDAIGYFGTGLKYALAVLLREGCDVSVYMGNSEITVKTQPIKIRGEEFDVVHFNDQEAPFTTDLGKNWELWMAYRELHANCIDEQNWTIGRGLKPQKGYTTISVGGKAFSDLFEQQEGDSIFLNTDPLFVLDGLELAENICL